MQWPLKMRVNFHSTNARRPTAISQINTRPPNTSVVFTIVYKCEAGNIFPFLIFCFRSLAHQFACSIESVRLSHLLLIPTRSNSRCNQIISYIERWARGESITQNARHAISWIVSAPLFVSTANCHPSSYTWIYSRTPRKTLNPHIS